ncbi:pyridoxal phosphate-dependent aminotransferase [Rhodocytophaga aerolata]|uniref:Aminotransferase n=1 Tax=Rhodocytophaga aerolata TaxID=455078 RepID=A0ABT8R1S8_9BACT|nr:pyridoxal phosphate-dependent aminotransferase [Rhodocytophaga aerolata]MDO1444747.1 pyridoxal phosphate-dependent aminotransferase [Rhodocytophaga aerolata]
MSLTKDLTLLSDRINALSESQTLAMSKKSRELAAQGHQVINLSIGEPDFQTPQHIKDAAKKAIDEGFSFYTPVSGIAELRQAIAEKLRKENNIDWKAENIVVSTGAKQSLANALMCLVNPGDEVIIFSPYWVSYSEMVKLAEGETVLLEGPFENDFKVTADQLEKAITPRTKVIMYSSPSNPTGSVFTEQELREIAEVVAKHDNIFVIADEIYEYINYEPDYFSIGSIPAIKDRVITINGVSKGFAMTGWRIGYMAAAKWIADACDKLQGQITSGTCSIAQKAAVAAIKGDMAPTREMAQAYLRRRDLVLSLLKEIPGIKTFTPKGAFYVFPDVSDYFGKTDGKTTIQTADDLCMYILNKVYVSLVTGDAFGAPNCIRISYAASDESLTEALRRVKEALAQLN